MDLVTTLFKLHIYCSPQMKFCKTSDTFIGATCILPSISDWPTPTATPRNRWSRSLSNLHNALQYLMYLTYSKLNISVYCKVCPLLPPQIKKTCRVVLSRTIYSLTKFIEKCTDIYDTKLGSLDTSWNIFPQCTYLVSHTLSYEVGKT